MLTSGLDQGFQRVVANGQKVADVVSTLLDPLLPRMLSTATTASKPGKSRRRLQQSGLPVFS
jgi:hypothetical protein